MPPSRRTNGANTNGGRHSPYIIRRHLPPSTLADQIVQTHNNGQAITRPEHQAVFAQLLEDIRALPSAIESDVESNFNLIQVLVDACLDPLTKQAPFRQQDEVTTQALAGLDVIDIAVQRSPHVLCYASPTGGRNEEMHAWLLPKFLSLAALCTNWPVQERIERSLTSWLHVLESRVELWKDLHVLIWSLRSCFEDLLHCLGPTSYGGRNAYMVQQPIAVSQAPELSATLILLLSAGVRIETHGLTIARILFSAIWKFNEMRLIGSISPNNLSPAYDHWLVTSALRFLRVLSHMTGQPQKNIVDSRAALGGMIVSFASKFLQCTTDDVLQHIVILIIEFVSVELSELMKGSGSAAPSDEFIQSLSLLSQMIRLSPRVLFLVKYKLMGQLEALQALPALHLHFRDLSITCSNLFTQLRADLAPVGQFAGKTDARKDKGLKRRRISDETLGQNDVANESSNLYKAPQRKAGIVDLEKQAPSAFVEMLESLNVENQKDLLNTMAQIPCAADRSRASKNDLCLPLCHCAHWSHKPAPLASWNASHWSWYARVISALIHTPFVQSSSPLRVLLMNMIGTYAEHYADSAHLNLADSLAGQWCLQGLKSSSRELRIAASQSLAAILQHSSELGGELSQNNRILALNMVRQLCDSGDVRYAETSISTLGLIGTLCNEEERIFVLEKLLDYLGHKNNFVCGLAYLELEYLAEALQVSPDGLFRPYWHSLGIGVVQDITHSPQKCQQVADLLGFSVSHFLQLTQADTIPFLVLGRRRDVLQKLASSRGKIISVWKMCMQPRNLTAILSLLVAQNPVHLESFIVECLGQASDDFKHEDLSNLMKMDPIPVACEVLRLAGDNPTMREKAFAGFEQFTMLAERGHTQSRSSKTDATASFFTNHALGIMTSFANMIDGPLSNMEKKRCLRGVECMVTLGGETIVVALPQIRACLQSAFKMPELCTDAFSAWAVLVDMIKDHDYLKSLVENTFASVVQHWTDFDESTQKLAYNLVAKLLGEHGQLVQDDVLTFPSLGKLSIMSKFEAQLERLRSIFDPGHRLLAYQSRCERENPIIVLQALQELLSFLEVNQQWLHEAVITDPPNPCIASLVRVLLDVCLRFKDEDTTLAIMSAKCLGIIGCLDQTRIEAPRDHKELIVLSNFELADEAVSFVAFLLENVLVKCFNSVSNPRAQGFLAYVMQELLKFCGFSREITASSRHSTSPSSAILDRWWHMPELVTDVLKPFLTSKYVLTTLPSKHGAQSTYPIYTPEKSHGAWLRELVFDLLMKAKGDNAKIMFTVLSRVIRGYDVSISSFLLPFTIINVLINGTDDEMKAVIAELLLVLGQLGDGLSQGAIDNLRLCSEDVFQVLDYLSRWLQAKRKALARTKDDARRQNRSMDEIEETSAAAQINTIEFVLSSIPADVISRRAVECGSFSRALLHWELHMRELRETCVLSTRDNQALYLRLQEIYSQIDEPDGLEGIAMHIQTLPPEQQALEHRRAGRWAVAQSWYELELLDKPDDVGLHSSLLECLKDGGQYRTIAEHVTSKPGLILKSSKLLAVAAEAGWRTEAWQYLEKINATRDPSAEAEFNVGIAGALLCLKNNRVVLFNSVIDDMRADVTRAFSNMNTSSLQASHDQLLKLHALYDMEILSRPTQNNASADSVIALQPVMSRRLNVLGAFLPEKQYLLGIRRAMMRVSPQTFGKQFLAAAWMTTATLARKSNTSTEAYEAVLHGLKLKDESAKIEQARLLWKSGEHDKAIQSLEAVIAANSFDTRPLDVTWDQSLIAGTTSTTTAKETSDTAHNILAARAHLLLAKWLDRAGSSQFVTLIHQYQTACKLFSRWEKGFYYLGKYYNKLIDAEKALDPNKRTVDYLSGLMAKHVVENYLRSLNFGCKYLFETLPKLLTLWLDAGMQEEVEFHSDFPDELRKKVRIDQPEVVKGMNKAVRRHTERITPYIFYTALAQMITRISHPSKAVCDILSSIILKVLIAYPQQGLWPMLAVVKSSSPERASRGLKILGSLKTQGKTIRHQTTDVDAKNLITLATKMSEQLLRVSDLTLGKDTPSTVSLTKTLGFNTKVAPCPLVVPWQKMLSATLPSISNSLPKGHKAFPESREAITITYFLDEVLVMSSLQKPRKITIRGSDGIKYGILCKPKDDLRKDQRLMEFNAMINRGLKKDAESSKRRLYVRTYAVIPLNEECGLLEWVDGLKPMRDILVALYKQKGMRIDYVAVRELLDKASAKPVTADNVQRHFSGTLLSMFPPVLHEWFLDVFPEPEAWFAARLRYARSAAVTSVVYHALGLGDRHGENVLLEQSGGVFHVDFNCLFDKGLTFDKPELVPFRLTHNMVDALGAYGVEGPFRRSAHHAMRVMRAQEDALLTIIETFVYDPTTDFVGPPRKRAASGVPQTPKEVLESVRGKIEGYLRGESVPLSVEGYVDALVRQATDPTNLSGMYIGWCAFF